MDKRKNELVLKFDQINQLQNIARLVDENQELQKKYKLVSSKLDLLKNRMQNLSHDLQNPALGITVMVDQLIIEDKGPVEVQTHDLIMIKESAQSLLDLINGTMELWNTQICLKKSMNTDRMLSTIIKEINRLYLPMAQNKDISLSVKSQIDKELQLQPNFFINLIQIIGNLVANAIKFTPFSGAVDVVFTLDTDENQNILNMIVTDTGISMSPDQVSAFNQGRPVPRAMGTNGEQGFGIGLQHVIQMVSENNGSIFVKSGKSSGTKFSISFPLPDKNLYRKNGSYSTVKNGAVLLNGSQS